MSGTGQKCTATRRVITVGKIHEPFLAALANKVEALVVGNGLDPETTTGPVVSASAKADIESAIADAISQGGRIVAQAPTPTGPGFFVSPTVIEGTMELRTCKEEVFGPVTTVINVKSLDEALEIANSTEFGLTASFFSNSSVDIKKATKGLVAGLIKINAPNTGSELHVPFGGLKASTFPGPREQNAATASDFYTTTKSVYRRIAPERKSS
jgi:aldehyde dehydrogenase (NAD+)